MINGIMIKAQKFGKYDEHSIECVSNNGLVFALRQDDSNGDYILWIVDLRERIEKNTNGPDQEINLNSELKKYNENNRNSETFVYIEEFMMNEGFYEITVQIND